MVNRITKNRRSREQGFTLIEGILVLGLTMLITVGIIAALLEGLDTLHIVTDTQSVEFGHQRAMTMFIDDVQSATWFYNGTMMQADDTEVLRDTTAPFELTMGYPGPRGDEIWIRYSVQYGVFTRESYLLRTVMTLSDTNEGSTIVTTGVANLMFNYFDDEGAFTDQLDEIGLVQMVLSLNVGGSSVQREYDVSLRNANQTHLVLEGTVIPPRDFDEFETTYFKK